MFTSWVLGDAITVMLIFNLGMLWPLAYQKKHEKIDQIMRQADLKLETILKMLPFVGKRMREVSEAKKKQ